MAPRGIRFERQEGCPCRVKGPRPGFILPDAAQAGDRCNKAPRTSNPIESTFATVRHRTIRAKGCLPNKTALAIIFKLVDAAQKSWRRLDGHNQSPKLIQGVRFTNGIEVAANAAFSQSRTAAA